MGVGNGLRVRGYEGERIWGERERGQRKRKVKVERRERRKKGGRERGSIYLFRRGRERKSEEQRRQD